MVVNSRPLKRMKPRVTAELNDFLSFPSSESTATGPFRTSVREFLLRHALLPLPSSLLPHLLTWQILFRVGEKRSNAYGDASVCLDLVEEDVIRSRSVYCDQCRVVGWSGNPVCGKRYHFIIKGDRASIGGYNKPCAGCGALVHLSDSSHLLHDVVHMNGYCHILRVNGRQGGSQVLSGRHIMDFWDRLCKVLGVKYVNVMDVSKKYGLEFRLLHSVVKGHPWYGDWGYEFGSGSYAITHEAYNNAIETLANMPLSALYSQVRKPRTHLHDLISLYQSLSDQELVTGRDLFHYLTTLLHKGNKNQTTVDDRTAKKVKSSDSGVLCVWNMSDVFRVEEAMFRVLKSVSGSSWVSWRSLRGAVCRVGSPELLDYCLKELQGKQAADAMVVKARSNPDSGALEYRLEPCSYTTNNRSIASNPSEDNLIRDLNEINQPPEHIILPPNATVGDLKVEASKAFQEVYLILRRFQAGELVGYRGVDESTQIKLLMGSNVETVVNVIGKCSGKSGLSRFRMERGVETWTLDCSCGAKDDDGERMLACD
ncbi:hypothetical protein L1987_06209 [Smallanthus sonchifolius]|uniref:Uncharacterized protein n=1 Tax=Smallanthus sonchifolius TaxID=185202 RepID=A0ACB9JXP9_9ASTR|nr:hypothetical protein L1987_06209 [Smallanthus sonchifolius]